MQLGKVQPRVRVRLTEFAQPRVVLQLIEQLAIRTFWVSSPPLVLYRLEHVQNIDGKKLREDDLASRHQREHVGVNPTGCPELSNIMLDGIAIDTFDDNVSVCFLDGNHSDKPHDI